MQAANTRHSKPNLRRDAHSASSVGSVRRRDSLVADRRGHRRERP